MTFMIFVVRQFLSLALSVMLNKPCEISWKQQLNFYKQNFYKVFIHRAQLLYFRAVNSTDAMIYVVLMQNGRSKRFFPIGARADSHVTLVITEDMEPGNRFEVYLAAPKQLYGWIVMDIGLIEF